MLPVSGDEVRCTSLSRLTSWRAAGRLRQAVGLALLLALPGGAQYGPMNSPPQQPNIGPRQGGMGDVDPVAEERRLKALNAERQKSLVSDTNRLLKLARELDDEVQRTNSNSPDQAELTKVAEIEKLAHKVKEKMSTSVRATTDFQPFLSPRFR